MNRNLLIGIIVVLGIAMTIFNPIIMGVAAIPTLIYLVRIVWKKKTNIFSDQMEPGQAVRRLKRLHTFLIIAAISCLVSIAGIILHNLEYSPSKIFELIFFIIAIAALWIFIITTAGGLVIYLKGRPSEV